jgi:hypothetical protein
LPIVRVVITPADPCQRNESPGFVHVEILDEFDEFAAGRAIRRVGQHDAFLVVAGVGRIRIDANVFAQIFA